MTIELSGADGTKQTREVVRGGGSDPHSLLDPLGLTLDDGKTLLASVQRHLVQARVSDIYKAFDRTRALAGAGVAVDAGEVHALLGQTAPANPRSRASSADTCGATVARCCGAPLLSTRAARTTRSPPASSW